MSIRPAEVHHEALADYGMLLHEATQVLAGMARDDLRGQEYEELQEIYAEGADFHGGGFGGTGTALRTLADDLRAMFRSVMALGALLSTKPNVPETTVAALYVVDSMTRSLSEALELLHDPVLVSRKVEEIASGVHALDPSYHHHPLNDPVQDLLAVAGAATGALAGLTRVVV